MSQKEQERAAASNFEEPRPWDTLLLRARGSTLRRWEERDFDLSLWAELGRTGLLGMIVPTDDGGLGLNLKQAAGELDRFTWLSRDAGLGNAVGMHAIIGIGALLYHGGSSVCQRYLNSMMTGEKIACFALTETGAGSDAMDMQTRVERCPGGFKVTGHKYMISLAPVAELAIVFGQSDEGHVALVVDLPGSREAVRVIPRVSNVIRTCPVGDLYLDNVFVPDDHVLAQPGLGFKVVATHLLGLDRAIVFAFRLGRLRSILEMAIAFGRERKQFGKSLSEFQSFGFRIADVYAALKAGEALVETATHKLQSGDSEARTFASVARLLIGDFLDRAGIELVEMLGARGTEPGWAWMFLADSRLDRLGGGTSEIQRMILHATVEREFDARPDKEELLREAADLVDLAGATEGKNR